MKRKSVDIVEPTLVQCRADLFKRCAKLGLVTRFLLLMSWIK